MRVKSPRRQRHNKILHLAKGYRMARHRWYKIAHESVIHAGQYAYAGRKLKKRDIRSLWITRINAALRLQENPISYSKFIAVAAEKKVTLNRKTLSELAVSLPEVFSAVFKFTTTK